MDDKFPSNSKKVKKVKKVVNGKIKKKNNFLDVIFSEDADSVKEYIISDIIIPNAKKLLSEIITKGSDMLLYGEARSTRKENRTKVSYNRYYDDSETYRNHRVRTGRYSFDDILIENRGEAEEVLFQLDELINEYGIASVANFYEMVGIDDSTYIDNDYGWTDIRTAKIVRTRDGYIIKLPRPVPLN